MGRQTVAHKPYRDDMRARLDEDVREGRRPVGWEGVPWCGNPGCDEVTRSREEPDETELGVRRLRGDCHPALRF
ncbi:hypothetical protein ACWGDX_13325 [Streptomyces sp. NPDC055025]